MAEPTKRGTGWIVFAGVLMVLAGLCVFARQQWAMSLGIVLALDMLVIYGLSTYGDGQPA
jgi:uncharacterized membrane protein HdeD (DUF308 family)